MKIFGHPWVESECFYPIQRPQGIAQTPPNSTLKINSFDRELMVYCQSNGIAYAIQINSLREAIFANLLGAKYMITHKALATTLMPVAQNYLFDSQVLATISEDAEIEEMAKIGVDGVIFR